MMSVCSPGFWRAVKAAAPSRTLPRRRSPPEPALVAKRVSSSMVPAGTSTVPGIAGKNVWALFAVCAKQTRRRDSARVGWGGAPPCVENRSWRCECWCDLGWMKPLRRL